jgi:hypothetical protein
METDTSAESWGQVWRGGVVLVGWCWVGVWGGADRPDCPRHEDPLKTRLDGPRHEDLLETWLVGPRHEPLVNWTREPIGDLARWPKKRTSWRLGSLAQETDLLDIWIDGPRPENPSETWLVGPRHEDSLETWLDDPKHEDAWRLGSMAQDNRTPWRLGSMALWHTQHGSHTYSVDLMVTITG